VKEYDLFIPLFYNDGTPIEVSKFQDLQTEAAGSFRWLDFFSATE
jgi:hypothetical protein